MRHGSIRQCAMPMLFPRRAPHHISGSDDLDRAAPALHKAAAGRDDERLTERMRVPIAARAMARRTSRTRHSRAPASCRVPSKSGSTRTVPVKYSAGPLAAEGCDPFRFSSICKASFDVWCTCLDCESQGVGRRSAPRARYKDLYVALGRFSKTSLATGNGRESVGPARIERELRDDL